MAKFNQKNTIKIKNRSGFPAYRMEAKEQLVTAVLTTLFGEPKYYGSTDTTVTTLAAECAKTDAAFLCKLACYARNTGNLRSVSHVLACIIACEAHEWTRVTLRNILVRPDDITEIMSCYLSMYGKPFPNAMKREMGAAMQKFDEYQLAKYNGGTRSLKLRDVLRITHPVPKDKATEELFRKILDGTLETPYTWEVELSARGNTRDVWNELIASGKVGYMALLRNLSSILQAGANVEPVLSRLADPEQVRRSRQLPFRFYSAYRTLSVKNLLTPEIHRALEVAIRASIDNMERFAGRTLIAVDVSASMCCTLSLNSSVRCCDIASLLGAMAGRLCEDAVVCYFSYGSNGFHLGHAGKFDSILHTAMTNAFSAGGTDMSLPLLYALQEDGARNLKPFDRIIYFSDNECNRTMRAAPDTMQGLVDRYRAKYNKELWVHCVDLQGYGTQQFCGDKFNLIAGWSESVLSFIHLAEAGISSLVETIEAYEPDSV